MVKNRAGEFVEWTRGLDHVLSFLEYGYVKVSDNKFCPHLRKRCIGEKCALYVIRFDAGDCAHVWGAMK